MKIRGAKKSDINSLVKLDKLSSKEIKWWEPLSKLKFLKILKNKNLLYLAEEEKQIIAYLSGRVEENLVFLENIFVKKEFRKKGIAKKLIKKFCLDWKKSKTIRLTCPKRLKKFYEKRGFKITSINMKL